MQASSRFPLKHVYQDTHLVVPEYQRSYEWKTQHVNDLLSDIETIYTKRDTYNRDADHLFGTVVLVENGSTNISNYENWNRFDVVDGQQRLTTTSILGRCLATEFDKLQAALSETALENIQTSPAKTAEELLELFVSKNGTPHIDPETRVDEVYERLIRNNDDPAVILDDPEYKSSLFERRLAQAKQEITNWITVQREDHGVDPMGRGSDTELLEYYNYLQDVFSIVSNNFRVLIDVSESTGESARNFRNLNIRGKDASQAAQIKSHLMTIAHEDPQLDSSDVATRFNSAIERISQHENSTEQDLENFLRTHWLMFTGETRSIRTRGQGPSAIEDRVMKHPKHGALSRPPQELRAWLTAYIDTLEDSVEWYYYLKFPEKFIERFDGDVAEEIGRRMYAITSSQDKFSSAVIAVLIPLLQEGGENSYEALRVLTLAEAYTVRYHHLMKRGRTAALESALTTRAQRLTWIGNEDQLDTVFDQTGKSIEAFGTSTEAVRDVTEYIRGKIAEKCDDEALTEYLVEEDILDGEFRNQWGGARMKGVKYLLYEYERNLRQDSDSAMMQIPSFNEILKDYDIEHIASKNPMNSERLPEHERYVNRLGNLALLGSVDNMRANNKPYAEKYNEFYSDSMFRHLDELPTPTEGWDNDEIEGRKEMLISFVLERWSGDSIDVSPSTSTSTLDSGSVATTDGGW